MKTGPIFWILFIVALGLLFARKSEGCACGIAG
jgi:hypothetical protein